MNKFQALPPKKIIKAKAGFTLVEIITVLFVVSLGLVGILALITQNIQSQSYNKNNLIAYQLAQEGIELIRQVRDSNWKVVPGVSFNTNLAPEPDVTYQYYMDYLDSAPHDASSDTTTLTVLKQDSQGFYSHHSSSDSVPSGFSRLITVQENSDGTYLQVISRVFWSDHNHKYNYDLETRLYDWK